MLHVLTKSIFDVWVRDGLAKAVATRVQPLVGEPFATAEAYKQAIRVALLLPGAYAGRQGQTISVFQSFGSGTSPGSVR